MNERLELALVLGSTREGRLCDTVAAWAAAGIERHGGFSTSTVDPADGHLPAPFGRANPSALAAMQAVLERADAFVVVTPEYNHGYTAALKDLIDATAGAWRAKPVGFVAYGGVSGGLRAVEQLRQVFAEMHAATVRNTVSFQSVWEQLDDGGRLRDAPRAQRAMAGMLDQLQWWASALRNARRTTPYGSIAA